MKKYKEFVQNNRPERESITGINGNKLKKQVELTHPVPAVNIQDCKETPTSLHTNTTKPLIKSIVITPPLSDFRIPYARVVSHQSSNNITTYDLASPQF